MKPVIKNAIIFTGIFYAGLILINMADKKQKAEYAEEAKYADCLAWAESAATTSAQVEKLGMLAEITRGNFYYAQCVENEKAKGN